VASGDAPGQRYRLAQAYRKLDRAEDADREQAPFRRPATRRRPVRALYQRVQEQKVLHQTVDPGDSPYRNACDTSYRPFLARMIGHE
jgi:hypothetical protein